MARADKQGTTAVRLLLILLCPVIVSLPACSSLKSRKDDDGFVEGATVSLDELEYTKGLNPPRPEREKPPSPSLLPGSLPQAGLGAKTPRLTVSAPGPVRHLKNRVLVLPFENNSDYLDQPYGQIVTRKLVQALEGSDRVLVLDTRLAARFASEKGITQDDLSKPIWAKALYRTLGVHALVSGSLAALNVASTTTFVSREIKVGLAVASIKARLVDASTGNTIRTYAVRNPLYKSKEIGEFNRERAILRAIDIGVDQIARGISDSLEFFDWSARVVRIEPGRVYIDSGQQSGLRRGDILDVYGPGEEIVNPLTRISLGWAPGPLKGRIRVSGFFGIDGAYGTPLEGNDFRTEDLVKLSESQQE
ncbi:MAG: hypothetical protein JRH07_11325 [Deltaproteobacteria bacterium]|nr:hypothetical protein [Deltaproteobacteria bacterium]